MQLTALVSASREVSGTHSRLNKRALLAQCLRAAGAQEAGLAVSYLAGRLPQGRIGLGSAILRSLAGGEPAREPGLSLREVDAAFAQVATLQGKGSQSARRERLRTLFSRATREEQDFLVRLILGELRQGALDGALIDAIAQATDLPAGEVRRASMLAGDPAAVALAAFAQGHAGLAGFRLAPLSPVQPMLAQPAEDMAQALQTLGEAALEYKLDGARVQIHKAGSEVRIFSRGLNDVTGSLPDIVERASGLPARSLILDGEVIALGANGRPRPFQVTMRRFGRKIDVASMRESQPLDVFLFDCLHRDGEDLIDRPAEERFASLADATGKTALVRRTVTDDPRAAQAFLDESLAHGHEGVMAKSLSGLYAAGSRGAQWLKVKQAHSFDLVVLAAEWGSGRRKGWLSNLHLGARDPDSGGFVMLGKTFKGLTDRLLAMQTAELLAREVAREGHVVHVRPELVVEIAVNEVQSSPHYPAGMALRFARVKRYRPDKRAGEADTVDAVRALHRRQNTPSDA